MTASKETPPLTFATETSPSEATIRAIESGLTAHATGLGLLTDWSPRWIIGRDEGEVVQAGVRFVLAFEWLFVNWLWGLLTRIASMESARSSWAARKRPRERKVAAPRISTPSHSRRRSFTSGSVIGSSVDSMIFHPATHAFGFQKHFAESMHAACSLPSPSGRRWRNRRRKTPVFRRAVASDEGAAARTLTPTPLP